MNPGFQDRAFWHLWCRHLPLSWSTQTPLTGRRRNGKHFFQIRVLNCTIEMPVSFWWLWREPGGIVLDGDICMWPDASYTDMYFVAHKLRGMEMGFAHSPSRFAAPDDSNLQRVPAELAFWHSDCGVYCRRLSRSWTESIYLYRKQTTKGEMCDQMAPWDGVSMQLDSHLNSWAACPGHCWNDPHVAQVRMKILNV